MKRLGKEDGLRVAERAERGEPDALEIRRQVFRELLRAARAARPRPKSQRRALRRISDMLRQTFRGLSLPDVAARRRFGAPRFGRCPLCGFLRAMTYGRRARPAWHRRCFEAWWRYWRRAHGRPPTKAELPPPLRGSRGPARERDLLRNFKWVVARALKRRVRGKPSKIRMGRQAFVRLLPGTWDLVYTQKPYRERTNKSRQTGLVPLPDALQPSIMKGKRDPVILRLRFFGMRVQDIKDVTGAPRAYIRRLVPPTTTRRWTPDTILRLAHELAGAGGVVARRKLQAKLGGKCTAAAFATNLEILERRGDVLCEAARNSRGPAGMRLRLLA